jgi:uridylate kinase
VSQLKRVLIKLSGRAVAGESDFGFSATALDHIAREVLSVRECGTAVAIVIGGGNVFRGKIAEEWGIERAEADNIGVLGTAMNSLLLRGVLKARGAGEVRVMSALRMDSIAEPFIRLRATHHLEKGYVVIFAGGIGQPYVTTDYPSVQRALEVNCDALLVAKHGVDGVYDGDPRVPRTGAEAKRYRELTYDDAIRLNLKVMDQSAVILARDFKLPLHVFNFDASGAMARICKGERGVGTEISPRATTTYA